MSCRFPSKPSISGATNTLARGLTESGATFASAAQISTRGSPPRKTPLSRAKTPLGTWGKVTRRKLGPTTWRARATMRGYDGKPRMYQMTGPTGAQAETGLLAKLNAMLPPTDDVISPDMAMSELAKFWWLEFEDLKRAANTRRRYREIIDTYILPGVGNLTIREANVSTLDKFLKGVRTKHGNATAKMSKTLLTGMLSLATRHGAAAANPLREVSRIPTDSKEVRALTIDEVAKLRHDVYAWQQPTGRQNGLHEKDILDAVDIMLATGARIGEALAIRWSDVDLVAEKPTVTVRGTIIDVRGKNGLMIQDHPGAPTRGNATSCHLLLWRCCAGARLIQFARMILIWCSPPAP